MLSNENKQGGFGDECAFCDRYIPVAASDAELCTLGWHKWLLKGNEKFVWVCDPCDAAMANETGN